MLGNVVLMLQESEVDVSPNLWKQFCNRVGMSGWRIGVEGSEDEEDHCDVEYEGEDNKSGRADGFFC